MSDDAPKMEQAFLRNAQAYAAAHVAEHFRPLQSAIAARIIDGRVMFRDTVGLAIDTNLSTVVTIFDLEEGGRGPSGFDAGLLGTAVMTADGIAVVTNFESPDPYIWIVQVAVKTGGMVLLVETTPAWEQEWLNQVKKCRSPENWSLWSSAVQGRG